MIKNSGSDLKPGAWVCTWISALFRQQQVTGYTGYSIIQDASETSGVLHINTKQVFNTTPCFQKQSCHTPAIASLPLLTFLCSVCITIDEFSGLLHCVSCSAHQNQNNTPQVLQVWINCWWITLFWVGHDTMNCTFAKPLIRKASLCLITWGLQCCIDSVCYVYTFCTGYKTSEMCSVFNVLLLFPYFRAASQSTKAKVNSSQSTETRENSLWAGQPQQAGEPFSAEHLFPWL